MGTTKAEMMKCLYVRYSTGLRAGDVDMSRAHNHHSSRDNVNISDPSLC